MVEVEAYGVPDAAVSALRGLPGVRETAIEERGALQLLTVQSDAHVDVQGDILRELAGIRLGRVNSREPTLEDAYVAIVNAARPPEESREAIVNAA